MCLRGLLLIAGLFLGSWALTPEECEPMMKPQSLADHSMIHGTTYFLAGYGKSNVHKAILKNTKSFWINMTQSESNPIGLEVSQINKVNGSCFLSLFNVTIDGDAARGFFANITQSFQFLPSSDGLLVTIVNSTIRNSPVINRKMKHIGEVPEEFDNFAMFLMGRNSTLKDSDLEDFKKRASCFGFSGEPEFVFNSETGGFCSAEEAIKNDF